MLLDDDDHRDLVAALGDDQMATVGTSSFAVVLNGDSSAHLSGETIDAAGPYAVAAWADVEPLALASGNNGDILTIGGVDYKLMALDPDGSGAVVLSLNEVA